MHNVLSLPHQVSCETIKPNLRLFIFIIIIHLQGKAVCSYLREPVVLHQLQLFSMNTTNYVIVFMARDSDSLRAGRPGSEYKRERIFHTAQTTDR